jgi:hypothetical protein
VKQNGIEPHVSVIEKSCSKRRHFISEEFAYDAKDDIYICPGGKPLSTTGTLVNNGATMLYRACNRDCGSGLSSLDLSHNSDPQSTALDL